MTGLSVSAIDDRYVLQRMSLGYIEAFLPTQNSSAPLWQEFSLEQEPKGRMHLPKTKVQQNTEEKLDDIFLRVDILLVNEAYAKASQLLEQVLDLTEKNFLEREKFCSYRAAAYFHLGRLYANPGEDEDKSVENFSYALRFNSEFVQLAPTEKSVGRLLRSHLELGRVHYQFGKKEPALEEVQHVLRLSMHYVDVISLEQYTSFTQSAQLLGAELLK